METCGERPVKHSDQLNDLAAALSKTQGAIKTAVKAKENPFFKSRYADLPSIMAVCRDALTSNGLAVTQVSDFEGPEMWLDTMLIHSSGQWIAGRYPIRPVKNDPQGLGSAQSYARRYALMAMIGIVADDDSEDDGNLASGHKANGNGHHVNGNGAKITSDQVDTLRGMAVNANADVERFCEFLNVPSLAELPAAQFARAVDALNAKIKAARSGK